MVVAVVVDGDSCVDIVVDNVDLDNDDDDVVVDNELFSVNVDAGGNNNVSNDDNGVRVEERVVVVVVVIVLHDVKIGSEISSDIVDDNAAVGAAVVVDISSVFVVVFVIDVDVDVVIGKDDTDDDNDSSNGMVWFHPTLLSTVSKLVICISLWLLSPLLLLLLTVDQKVFGPLSSKLSSFDDWHLINGVARPDDDGHSIVKYLS